MTFTLPPFFPGSVILADISVDYQRLSIVAIGALTFLGLYLFTHFNKLGLALRGIAQDERAAMMLGIDSDMTAVVSLAIGSGLAGICCHSSSATRKHRGRGRIQRADLMPSPSASLEASGAGVEPS